MYRFVSGLTREAAGRPGDLVVYANTGPAVLKRLRAPGVTVFAPPYPEWGVADLVVVEPGGHDADAFLAHAVSVVAFAATPPSSWGAARRSAVRKGRPGFALDNAAAAAWGVPLLPENPVQFLRALARTYAPVKP